MQTHEEQVRQRAYELYLARTDNGSTALDDWLRAEEELLAAKDAAIDKASEESFPASDPPSSY